MDRIGTENRFTVREITDFKRIYGEEYDSFINDLKNRKLSENVRLFMYNTLLNFQPVALSEMPEWLFNHHGWRTVYMLKTFTIKQFDVFRREAVDKMLYAKDKREFIEGFGNLVRQLDQLKQAGADEIHQEKITGTKADRPELNRLFDRLREGDTVLITDLTRLGRSTKDLFALVEKIKD